jgi:putative ABC transport system substrate-binding protein
VAAKQATTTVPIVFNLGADPVKLGLVASLNRPGGNLTGVAMLNVELEAKRFELLHELVPGAALIAFLINPTNPQAETQLQDVQKAARTIGQRVVILHANTEREVETAFATIIQERANALLVGADTFFTSQPTLFCTQFGPRHDGNRTDAGVWPPMFMPTLCDDRRGSYDQGS